MQRGIESMDFVKIKNMVRENGDKVIFMENGEPELVMMSFVEYEKLARLQLTDPLPSMTRSSRVDRVDISKTSSEKKNSHS